ncbi:4-hydroxy-tetrahydrodipicolinate synthase [Leadbettera azotonutricia]|uniref:4-hydroxy-tetrahydrodipicolinate synthase n=1 Tax=Leadbettera azotonutricia (strain ATCC BAA-888 / DSM 13862 / ZAS-9) TaxID=545695 RepID=F5YG02_LEAAZ|nr:4-hydroxy-tetrahydrodipicolinate synthase [Leadbettera azotonutricia]AEF81197.1 dihydrodipicolinate synthase [Leadbettera azotonutricia ZAS-9]
MIKLQGAFTAMVTPMKGDGSVDYDGFRQLIDFQIEQGIDGLVPLGTTGENPTLDEDEEEKLIKIAVEEVKGRVPVIIGTGSNDTRHMVAYTKRAKDLGADAALVVTPYYNKPNDSGLAAHFEAAAAVGIPVVVYNIASRTGRNIPASLMERIAKIPGIAGVKESSGDLGQIGDIINSIAVPRRNTANPFTVFSGDDAMALPLMALGGDGVISVVSNLVPAKVKALCRACLAGDYEEGRKLHFELLAFVKAAFIETNPAPIKLALTWAGLPGGPTRLPLGPISGASEEALKTAMHGLGIKTV